MIVEVNTNILKDLGITGDDFLYLYLLHATSHELISELKLKPNLEAVQTKGLIKLGEEPQDHVVRQAFLDSFQDSFDRMWSELLSHFPLKVYNQGHMRVLRAKDAFAKNNEKALRKYAWAFLGFFLMTILKSCTALSWYSIIWKALARS